MTMTATPRTRAGSNALVATVPGAPDPSGWPSVVNREIGTLPLTRLRRVTDHIREHLDHALTLAELGAVAYMSPYHFARLFHRTTGLPPHRFVVRARIDHAATLLAAPEPPIARISQLVGFRTPSHFTTVFRRLMGVTPSEYRARHLDLPCLPRARSKRRGEAAARQRADG
jgi:AraC-like DNA-binding protein